MSRFCPLFSSSKGNCVYLSGGGTSILVDAGVSFRRLKEALLSRGVELSSLSGILITHEHSDHIGGLKTMLKHVDIPLFASAGTLAYLFDRDLIPPHTVTVAVRNTFSVGGIEVTPFSTPHDANDSLGFRFTMPDQRRVAVATDLGHLTDTVRQHLTGCDLVMLESNYDRGMLDVSPYPYYLKLRIRGDRGHLDNRDCSGELARLVQNGTTRFVLGHLSEQNNLPQIAYEFAKAALAKLQMKEQQDYILQVAPAKGPGEMQVF